MYLKKCKRQFPYFFIKIPTTGTNKKRLTLTIFQTESGPGAEAR